MLFRLLDKSQNNLFWDNNFNIFYDQFHNPINLLNQFELTPFKTASAYFVERAYQYDSRTKDVPHHVETKNLKRVKFQLGMNCNESCLYCSQRVCRTNDKKVSNLDFLFDNLTTAPIDWSSLECIELWGGEPFVYWKTLKPLVEFLRNDLKYKGKIRTTTNASLFTDSIANWCIEQDLKIKFSHDGVNQKFQRSVNDWLDNPKIVSNVVRCIQESGGVIACEFSPLHDTNLFHSLDLFRERLGETSILFEGAFWCDNTNSYLLAGYTPQKIEEVSHSYQKILLASIDSDNMYYKQLKGTRGSFLDYLNRIVYGKLSASLAHHCASKSRSILTFDMSGNYLPCQGATANQKLGVGSIENVNECYDVGFTSAHYRPRCCICPYVVLCGGPCGYRHDLEEIAYCKSVRWSFDSMFRTAVKVLLDFDIVKIEPHEPSKSYC